MAASATHTRARFQSISIPDSQPLDRGPAVHPSTVIETSTQAGTQKNPIFFDNIELDPPTAQMFQDLHTLSRQLLTSTISKSLSTEPNFNDQVTKAEQHIDYLVHCPTTPGISINGVSTNSGSCLLAGYIYLYLFLKRIPLQNSVYEWMASLLKDEILEHEATMKENFPIELRFWVFFVGGFAAAGTKEGEWFRKELQILRIDSELGGWESASLALKNIVWIQREEDEAAKKFWEDAATFN